MNLKLSITFALVGMFAGLIFCSITDSNTWFAVGFAFFIGNMSMFYLAIRKQEFKR